LTGDLTGLEETKRLAAEVNALGRFDAVIHNAGVYQASSHDIFAVNTLAPYVLTCLIQKPQRLIYVSSGMHLQGDPSLKPITSGKGRISYSDSKLYVVLLAKAVARLWPDVYANAVDPGWVPTKMGGRGASDDLEQGYETQVWLATSSDANTQVSGRYYFHKKETRYHPATDQPAFQAEFLSGCERLTGVRLASGPAQDD
jgi:NAD(P)-dependent dehydrogenase (short-subunit alcohol dehydrogenase family)